MLCYSVDAIRLLDFSSVPSTIQTVPLATLKPGPSLYRGLTNY